MRVFITGTAGFIGFHLANILLKSGYIVLGYDGMTKYYDINLKKKRLQILEEHSNFRNVVGMLEDSKLLQDSLVKFKPDIVVHLAAQAGVRYSLENPRSYINSNIVGTFNLIEAVNLSKPEHLLMASTSSVYGANEIMPFKEIDKSDTPLTLYAATKKANESMAHSFAHIYKIPVTMFRFFTVYGPWGRPDMALFKFTKGILEGDPIDIYNNGQMSRDFTYVDDLVNGIKSLMETPPTRKSKIESDSISNVAPFRIVNIGNGDQVPLLKFIEAIEDELGIKAYRNYMPMQTGDVPATWADSSLLEELTGYKPRTNYKDGIKQFISWYREYYKK